MRFAIVLPTLNAANEWIDWLAGVSIQTVAPHRVLIIDSSSDDNTLALAHQAGFEALQIPRKEFNHGGTRQLALDLLSDIEIIVYMTQDAVLASAESLRRILAAFDDPVVCAAYGRQLPRGCAGPIEAHARYFNYPPESQVRSLQDRQRLGIKTTFISNSFAAYRRSALRGAGGFPSNVIMGEDQYAAARMLLSGQKISYVSDATVYHSHGYSYIQEFRRYFDIGVLHSREPWILQQFGVALGEGSRFVISELSRLWPRHLFLIPSALIRTVLKLVGYRAGLFERYLNIRTKRLFSMHGGYWEGAQPFGKH